MTTPPDQEPPTVRLPTDWRRYIEALHELAWRDLLDLVPGALEALVGQAASQTGVTADALAMGATVKFYGKCGADLFVVCTECGLDRAVIEIKGPQAKMNPNKGGWQTDVYRGIYISNPERVCGHLHRSLPLFIFLDAQNRTRQVIEKDECESDPALDGWAVLAYEEVLSGEPFVSHPLAPWLLGY